MMQSTIATLGDDYHTSVSTRAHKNNYFNIVYALHLPSSMWRAKVFADSSSSSSDSDSTELPRPKRKRSAPVASQVTKCKRERKALLKGEKKKMVQIVKDLDAAELSLRSVTDIRTKQMMNGKDIGSFCSSVDPKGLNFLAQHLQEGFVKLYNDCSSEKEHYLQFQIKWHKHCSYLLVEKNYQLTQLGLHPDDPISREVFMVRSQWHKLKEQHSLGNVTSCTFLSLFCSCVFENLLQECHKVMQKFKKLADVQKDPVADSEDVYYRFGGAAIASMLHSRYEKLKQHSGDDKQLSEETTILQKLSIHKEQEKEHIPDSLKYRDKGHMYFPCKELLPLVKEVDVSSKECTNTESFKKHGSELLTFLSNKFVQNTELRSMYLAILQAKVPESAHMKDKSVDGVFKEFVRKLCHTRVQEFLDSFKQQNAAHKGSATLAGQNLRDSLLSHHVTLKSTLKT